MNEAMWNVSVDDLVLDILVAADHPGFTPNLPADSAVVCQAALLANCLLELDGDSDKLWALRSSLVSWAGDTRCLAAALELELAGFWNTSSHPGHLRVCRLHLRGHEWFLVCSLIPDPHTVCRVAVREFAGQTVDLPQLGAVILRGLPASIQLTDDELRSIKESLETEATGPRAILEAYVRRMRRRFIERRVADLQAEAQRASAELRGGWPGAHLWGRVMAGQNPVGQDADARVQVIRLGAVEDSPSGTAGPPLPLEHVAVDPALERVAIVGLGGAGKSFVLARTYRGRLKKWTQTTSLQPAEDRFPLWLVPEETDYAVRIRELARKLVGEEWAGLALRLGALDVTIDALNEVSVTQRDLKPLLQELPRLRWVVASRQQFFLRAAIPPEMRVFYVCPLADEDLDDYVVRTLREPLATRVLRSLTGPDNQLRTACRQPLLLDGLAHLARLSPDRFPQNRFELLDRLIGAIVEREPTADSGWPTQLRQALEFVAWAMYDPAEGLRTKDLAAGTEKEPLTEIPAGRVTSLLESYFAQCGRQAPAADARRVLDCGLLAGSLEADDRLRFTHHVLLETLASSHLQHLVQENSDGMRAIGEYVRWPRLDGVVLGLVGLMGEASVVHRLLELIVETAPRILGEQAASLDWVEPATAQAICELVAHRAEAAREVLARRVEAVKTLERFLGSDNLGRFALRQALRLLSSETLPVPIRIVAAKLVTDDSVQRLGHTILARDINLKTICDVKDVPKVEEMEAHWDQTLAQACGVLLKAQRFSAEDEDTLIRSFIKRNERSQMLANIVRMLAQVLGGGRPSQEQDEPPLVVLARSGGSRVRDAVLERLGSEPRHADMVLELGRLPFSVHDPGVPPSTVALLPLLQSRNPHQRLAALHSLPKAKRPYPRDVLTRVLPLVRDLDFQVRRAADAALETLLGIADLTMDAPSSSLHAILAGRDVADRELSALPPDLQSLAKAWRGRDSTQTCRDFDPATASTGSIEAFSLACYGMRKEASLPVRIHQVLEQLGRSGVHKALSKDELHLALELVYLAAFRLEYFRGTNYSQAISEAQNAYFVTMLLWRTFGELDTIDSIANYLPMDRVANQIPIFQRLLRDHDPKVQMRGVEVLCGQCGSTLTDRRGLSQRIGSMAYEDFDTLYGPIMTLMGRPAELPKLLRQSSGEDAKRVACVLLMFCLAESDWSRGDASRETVDCLLDLVQRTPTGNRRELVPFLVPLMDDACVRQQLRGILDCRFPRDPGSQSDEQFGVQVHVLMANRDDWAKWAHTTLLAANPSDAQHEYVMSQYRASSEPIRSRLYELLSGWSDNFGRQRPI